MYDSKKQLKFIEKLDSMKFIYRAIILDNNTYEDDAQHSWHLAMMVMILWSNFPDLNIEKCIKIALIHDIPEIYAWDTVILDKAAELTKYEREKTAIEKLLWEIDVKNIWEFKLLWEEYKNKTTKEWRFVYELDKLQPIIQNVITDGKWWKSLKQDKNKIREDKRSKITNEFWLLDILESYIKLAEEKNMWYCE